LKNVVAHNYLNGNTKVIGDIKHDQTEHENSMCL